eukprot:scaffold8400_cov116-Isochrysis_galbana.AAC.2
MRANAEMILSRARQQGTICPAHAHRARVSHLTAHRNPNPVQVPHTTVATSLTAVPPWVLWGVTQRPTVSVGFPCVLRARLRACARGEEEGWGREALRPLLSKVARVRGLARPSTLLAGDVPNDLGCEFLEGVVAGALGVIRHVSYWDYLLRGDKLCGALACACTCVCACASLPRSCSRCHCDGAVRAARMRVARRRSAPSSPQLKQKATHKQGAMRCWQCLRGAGRPAGALAAAKRTRQSCADCVAPLRRARARSQPGAGGRSVLLCGARHVASACDLQRESPNCPAMIGDPRVAF